MADGTEFRQERCGFHSDLVDKNFIFWMQQILSHYTSLDLELRKTLVKCCIWSIALYGAETWTLRAVDQKQLESIEMWCGRRMENISWTEREM